MSAETRGTSPQLSIGETMIPSILLFGALVWCCIKSERPRGSYESPAQRNKRKAELEKLLSVKTVVAAANSSNSREGGVIPKEETADSNKEAQEDAGDACSANARTRNKGEATLVSAVVVIEDQEGDCTDGDKVTRRRLSEIEVAEDNKFLQAEEGRATTTTTCDSPTLASLSPNPDDFRLHSATTDTDAAAAAAAPPPLPVDASLPNKKITTAQAPAATTTTLSLSTRPLPQAAPATTTATATTLLTTTSSPCCCGADNTKRKGNIVLRTRRSSTTASSSFLERSLSSSTSSHHSRNNPTTCDICLEDYEVGQEVCWSKNPACLHAFHKECMLNWLLLHNVQCPVCRQDYVQLPTSSTSSSSFEPEHQCTREEGHGGDGTADTATANETTTSNDAC